MDRIRVAALQYYVRPVTTFDQFRDQVEALVDTAADYKCHLLVFPEYFTVQLLTLGDVKRPIDRQIRDLASQVPRFLELMSGLARKSGMYIVAGTIPVIWDPTVSFQLRRGFHILAVVQGYLRHDPESLGHAAVIEWLNPQVARTEDEAGRDPRFRVETPCR